MMKKLMVILERLVQELQLNMVLGETLICWVLEDYLVIITIMKTSIGNGLGSVEPISMRRNTIHEDHYGDLTKVMSPNGICCVCDQGCGSFMFRISSSGLNSSTRRKSMGGHLADVLSKVSVSDFQSEQSKAGTAESWMKLTGLKMSAVSMDVAEFWECTEQEVRDKYDLYLRTPPMARGRVQASAKRACPGWCTAKPRFQLIGRFSDPLSLTTRFRGPRKRWP